ncbi:MAG: DUF4349 domain-containing protein [Anaerolineae bacterium]|nr:DUF4349 domain-containing protein [Anaerolineae bacterium]
MRHALLIALIVIVLQWSVGCAAPAPPRVAVSQPAQPSAPAVSGAPAETAARTTAGDTERMIVRTAELSLVVTEAEPVMQRVTDLVTAAGGYIAGSQTWRENNQVRGRLTARIPAERLNDTLAAIKKLAVRVERENIGGKDVTEEYSDLNAQLVNLEATEKELRELLTEVRQKTQKAEDVLQVYQELTKVRGEIERIKGRMQYLSNQTALATVTLDLIPDALARPVVEPGWRPLETVKNASRALVNTLKGLVDVLIWLVIVIVPVLIILAIPLVLLAWGIRRLRRRRKPSA